MKIPILLFAAVVLGGILVAQNSKQGKDESAIRKADVEWSQAVEAKDLDKTVSFYADDASVYAPGAPIVTGKDNIRQAWGHMFDSPGFHLKFAPTKVAVAKSADLAYDAGTFEENVNGSDGTPITVHGKYVVVWKKQNGQWKAVADIFNADKQTLVSNPYLIQDDVKRVFLERVRHSARPLLLRLSFLRLLFAEESPAMCRTKLLFTGTSASTVKAWDEQEARVNRLQQEKSSTAEGSGLYDKLRQSSIKICMSLSEGSTSNGPNDFVIVSSFDLPMNHYQIKDGELRFRIIREYSPGEWRTLTLKDVLMHLVLKTDIAEWLYARRGDRREPLLKEHA